MWGHKETLISKKVGFSDHIWKLNDFDVRSKVDVRMRESGRSWAKLDGHLHQSGRCRTTPSGFLTVYFHPLIFIHLGRPVFWSRTVHFDIWPFTFSRWDRPVKPQWTFHFDLRASTLDFTHINMQIKLYYIIIIYLF